MEKPTVGVLLSGCGVYDGAEIHESVVTLLALDRAGCAALCIAPDMPQLHVVDHRTGAVAEGERRSVLAEAARIARGKVRDAAGVRARELDALLLPGGFGAAKNLCDFALKGADAAVHPEVARLVREVHAEGKWVGAMCIAPVILAKVLGAEKPKVTIGTDEGTAAAVEKMGARHVSCRADGIVVDEERRLVTTPAYMLALSIAEAAEGIEKLVAEVAKRVAAPVSR